MSPTVLDLFSGIGAFSLGLERAGMKTVRFCEINEFCRHVLAKHWPSVPCHDDVTTMEFQEGEADVICGGFPCQDLSGAGKRAGLSGTRSGLYRELVRAVRVVRPRVALLENVADLLRGPSDDPGSWFGEVLGDLAEGGACVEWDCVPASAIGAPHQRDRVWIVAHAPRKQVGVAGQSRGHVGMESGSPADAADTKQNGRDGPALSGIARAREEEGRLFKSERRPTPFADAACIGRGERRSRRPPDSFARIRDEARRNAADPAGARLAFREGLGRDAFEKLTPAERNARNPRASTWPDEPALSRVDDGDAYWMDRIAATGNQVVPHIPQLIGEAILEALKIDRNKG